MISLTHLENFYSSYQYPGDDGFRWYRNPHWILLGKSVRYCRLHRTPCPQTSWCQNRIQCHEWIHLSHSVPDWCFASYFVSHSSRCHWSNYLYFWSHDLRGYVMSTIESGSVFAIFFSPFVPHPLSHLQSALRILPNATTRQSSMAFSSV